MAYTNFFLSNTALFWVFLIFLIPSVICTLINLYYLLSKRTRRLAINNHVVILLMFNNLVYQLIVIPLFLNYYRFQYVWPATPSLCMTWVFIDEALHPISTILIAWASVERHILIFKNQWLSTTRMRFILHYIPITLLIIYIIIFHTVIILFPPCTNTFDYTLERCGDPLCFHDSPFVGTWDSVMNDIGPTLIIIIFSIALLIRVLTQNRRLHQQVQWRKYRRMITQMFSISALYFVFYVPMVTVELLKKCCIAEDYLIVASDYTEFFSYFLFFCLPFFCLFCLPNGRRGWRTSFLPESLLPTARKTHPQIMPTVRYFANQQPTEGTVN